MTTLNHLNNFCIELGLDIKSLRSKLGNIEQLTTEEKVIFVNSLNELISSIESAKNNVPWINDNLSANDLIFSSSKIEDILEDIKNIILGGDVDPTMDTLKEIYNLLIDKENRLTIILDQISYRLRYDVVQDLDAIQSLTARENIALETPDELVNVNLIYLNLTDQNTYLKPGYLKPGYFK